MDQLEQKVDAIQTQIAILSLTIASMQTHIKSLETSMQELRQKDDLDHIQNNLYIDDLSSSGNGSTTSSDDLPSQEGCQPFVMVQRHFLNISSDSEESEPESDLEEL